MLDPIPFSPRAGDGARHWRIGLPRAIARRACRQRTGARRYAGRPATTRKRPTPRRRHRWTPDRRICHADVELASTEPRNSARATALLARMRTTLSGYRDVQVAERDGYAIFLPAVPQPVYVSRTGAAHCRRWARSTRIIPLAVVRRPDGGFELVGAMYTARGDAAEDKLRSSRSAQRGALAPPR